MNRRLVAALLLAVLGGGVAYLPVYAAGPVDPLLYLGTALYLGGVFLLVRGGDDE